MPIDSKTIQAIIVRQFGQPAELVEQVVMGVMTFKYKLRVASQFYMLRIYPPANTTNVAFEFTIMQRLFLRGCKVPEPVAYNNDTSTSWLIYKYIPGLALSQCTVVSSTTIAQQIVENIVALCQEPIEGFGFLLSSDKPFDNWQHFLQDAIDKGEQYLANIKEIDAATRNLSIGFGKAQMQQVAVTKASLVWNDFSQDNIIINNNSLAGFVDFEGCLAGDPVMALGYLFALEGDSVFFKEVMVQYKKHFNFSYQTMLLYAMVRLFRLSKHVNNAFPTGIARDPLMHYFKGLPIAIEQIKSL